MNPMKKTLSRPLFGLITLALSSAVSAHSGHAPIDVHSHLGSPAMWLLLGGGVLGFTAAALIVWRVYRRRQTEAKQARQQG
ncbi:hypothetical protein QC823_14060 [Halomonas vilamensis]|uniref:Uncharacterized protein n=1 Tax=Vreelandella vilamensis TaxID=531309 RepID=A0ABU1H734_9GAMM|nr:hypothetical protein [Halomonas vilamensis]MDR5900106.1 hypothetical protein [Halomonas vilamensis]